jgi:hypothetical protein
MKYDHEQKILCSYVFPGVIAGWVHNLICFGYSDFANNDAAYPVHTLIHSFALLTVGIMFL